MRRIIRSLNVVFLGVPVIAFAAPVGTICGWMHNPTPQNYSLTDARAEWTLLQQGGADGAFNLDPNDPAYKAEAARDDAILEKMPSVPKGKRHWVATNGSYGFGCACLTGTVDEKRHLVMTIKHAKSLPLATCYADKNLPKPE